MQVIMLSLEVLVFPIVPAIQSIVGALMLGIEVIVESGMLVVVAPFVRIAVMALMPPLVL